MPRIRAAKFDEQLTLVEHLDELRNRIIVSAAVLVVACGLCFWQNHLLLEIANKPLPKTVNGQELKPITFGVAEPFMSTLKVSIYAGILIALPILLIRLYAFLLPALKPTEKRLILPFLILVPVLFIAGVVFSYFVVVPAGDEVPVELQPDRVQHAGAGERLLRVPADDPARAGARLPDPDGRRRRDAAGIVTPSSSPRTAATRT